MLQPEPNAEQNYRLPSQTVPLFPGSAKRSPTESDRSHLHRANSQHSSSDAPITFPLARSMSQSTLQPESSPTKRLRRRGLVLTEQGWQKLLQAEVVYNQFGERYTFAELSERTLLDPRTICRIVNRDEAVDKRSLKIFFEAFGLQLEKADYTMPIATGNQVEKQIDAASSSLNGLTAPTHKSQLCSEDVTRVRQRIIEDCCLLALLLGLEGIGQTTLSITLEPQAQPRLEFYIQHWC
jgi:hypothetical protein